MPNTAFGRKFQRRFLRCDALSGKAAVSRPALSHTKFFRRTTLLSLRIFPVFSTPRTAFTTARTVNEAVAAAFPPRFFVYRPTTSNSNLAPVVALTLGKADVSRKRPLSLRRKHCRTNRFFIRHSLPDRFNCSKFSINTFRVLFEPASHRTRPRSPFYPLRKTRLVLFKFYPRHRRSDRYDQRQCKG